MTSSPSSRCRRTSSITSWLAFVSAATSRLAGSSISIAVLRGGAQSRSPELVVQVADQDFALATERQVRFG
jgi:hypothetical protein